MKKYFAVISIIAACFFATGFTFRSQPTDDNVAFPEGYRAWTHIKSSLTGPQSPGFQANGGFHHIYANEKAMQGYSTGKFPEGSILVFDVIEVNEKNGNFSQGKRIRVDVMMKDSIKYSSTGGWGYDEFKESSKTERILTSAARTACFNCHSSQKDYIFSEFVQ